MELSQPLGAERNKGRKATHDFLSLCSSSTAQQDPSPSPSLGNNNYLKTHDFLQPLDRTERDFPKDEAIKKPPPNKAIEHVLHGGVVASYGISYPNPIRPLKLQDHGTTLSAAPPQTGGNIISNNNAENSRTFSIWDESAVMRKGKTGKENVITSEDRGVLRGLNWTSSSTNNNQHNAAAMLGSFSSSHEPQRNHSSFIDMISSVHNDREVDDDEDDDDVDDDEFVVKKEPSSHSKGSLGVKVEAKTMNQKPNTPRSKHSATEQRRRSKINDRFQKLREIIPNSDRKRDKASFLWEVIEHVQFLQEKVNRYEGSYDASCRNNNESSKTTMMHQWRNNGHNAVEGLSNISNNPALSTYVTTNKSEDRKCMIQNNGKNLAIPGDVNTTPLITALKDNKDHQRPPQDKTTRALLSPNLQQQELMTVESGTINISSIYSQGLLNAITKALQSSGVDLSQARISVQIDLAKRCNAKDGDVAANLADIGDGGFGQALKRLKTSLSN